MTSTTSLNCESINFGGYPVQGAISLPDAQGEKKGGGAV